MVRSSMNTVKITGFMLYLLCIGQAIALNVTLGLEDATQQGNSFVVGAGQTFTLKVNVQGGDRNTSDIDVAGLDQFQIHGTSRSTNITMVNNQLTSDTTHFYHLTAPHAGSFTLGPATVTTIGTRAQSNALQLNVQNHPAAGGNMPGRQQQGAKPAQTQHEVFCKLHVPKTSIVMGEPLTLTIMIYACGPILGVGMDSPTCNGFIRKEITQPTQRQEYINNIAYQVTEKKFILLPTQQGTRTIEPIKIIYNVQMPARQQRRSRSLFDEAFLDNFFSNRVEQKQTLSDPLTIEVKPLPAHTPAANGIGQFDNFTAHLEKQTTTAHEPVLLTLEVDGYGNVEHINHPDLSLPAHIKSYPSKSDFLPRSNPEIPEGKKRFEYVLQASKPGTWTIKEQTFTYFDTQTNSYKTLTTNPCVLHVQSNSGQTLVATNDREEELEDTSPEPTQNEQTQQTIDDIAYIAQDYQRQTSTPSFSFTFFLALLLLPLAWYRRDALRAFRPLARLPFLKKHYEKKQYTQFGKTFEKLEKTQDTCALYQFFLQFLSHKFSIPSNEFEQDLCKQALLKEGVEQEKVEEFLNYLNDCARVYFTRQSYENDNLAELFKKGKYWLLFLSK
ncbi:MAG: protein BatD [Epsilonproteobacteria bacterium]|nr:protein BatD [Campylobacterota bacterium]